MKSAALISLQLGGVGPVSHPSDISEFLTIRYYLRAAAAHTYYIVLITCILR